MERIATLEAEKKAKEDAAFEAEKAAQAAAEVKSANKALDATPNALMKCVGNLLEGTIAKRPREDENRPPRPPNREFSFAGKLLQPVSFSGNDCEGISYCRDVRHQG